MEDQDPAQVDENWWYDRRLCIQIRGREFPNGI